MYTRPLVHSLVTLSLIAAFTSCKATDAMDDAAAMKKDLAAMKSTTAGMAGTTEGMRDTTSELQRKASLGEGIKMISDPENIREYLPPQANMLAGAKLIAENMTSDELIKFFYVKLKELNNVMPDDSLFDRMQPEGYSAKYRAEFNRRKNVQVTIAMSIAAQIPAAMLNTLIDEQLNGAGGRFSDTMYSILMLRAQFINDFYLVQGTLDPDLKMDTLGKARDAFTYLNNLQEIASRSDTAKIVFVMEDVAFMKPVKQAKYLPGDAAYAEKCGGPVRDPGCFDTLGTAPTKDYGMSKISVTDRWTKFIAKVNEELPESLKMSNSPYANEIAVMLERAARYSSK